MKMLFRMLLCVCVCLFVSNVALGGAVKGKLIEFGWDMPDVPFLVGHIDRVKELPFDGVVIELGRRNTWSGAKKRQGGLAWHFWQKSSIDSALRKRVDEDITLLASVKSTGILKDSFLQVNAHPGGVDWFDDDAMRNVINNWKVAARAVKLAGVKGIWFDIEWYAKRKGPGWRFCIWKYKTMPSAKKYTYGQYREQVFECAKKIMSAIRQECPNMTIVFTFGNELVANSSDLPNDRHGLLPAFIDGFLVASGNDITIVDGYEHAYGFREAEQFLRAKKIVLEQGSKLSEFPSVYKKKMRVGYGLFIDRLGGAEWNTKLKDFDKNVYTPDELAYVVNAGLRYGDYVWIYTQKINWWTGDNCPKEYIEALNKAKKAEAVARAAKRNLNRIRKARIGGEYKSVREYEGFGEYTYMGNIWRKYQIVLKLPVIWKFKTDFRNIGEKEKWFSASCGKGGWENIIVPEWWNCADEKWKSYYGIGWYCVKFNVPEWVKGRGVYLYFGGVDEKAKVWLNGKLVGKFDIGSAGWNKPFKFDVTKYLRFDGENILVVRVDGGQAYGGIWRAVYLISPIK